MSAAPAAPATPALVPGVLGHVRHRPIRHAFAYRHVPWLIDVDDPPRSVPGWGRLVRFDAADRLTGGRGGRGGGGSRAELAGFLGRHELVLEGDDRVLLLAQPRVGGVAFDPLGVWWVVSPTGALKAVVLEVHNTYGQRHAYLVRPGAGAAVAADLDKEFYVSPFNEATGRYRVRVQLAPDRVRVSIVLTVDGRIDGTSDGTTDGTRETSGPVFTAWFDGTPRPATRAAVLGTLARGFVPHRTIALIRMHGIALWLRRLPVRTRPPHDVQEGIR